MNETSSTFLYDADGVTLIKQGYFSEKLSRDYGITLDKILPFFKNEYRLCQKGKADLKEVLPKYLELWNWSKSVDEFLDYWFTADTIPNKEALDQIAQISSYGNFSYLVTDQEKYRAEYIRKTLSLQNKNLLNEMEKY